MMQAWLFAVLFMFGMVGAVQAQDPNSADIEIQSSVTNMAVTINPGGSGCSSGQQWDVVLGRCTAATNLGSRSSTQYRSQSCASGYTGGPLYQKRSCSEVIYGWRTPPSGGQVVSYYGAPSCGSWTTYSGTCTASTPPATPPTSSTFTWSIFICGSGDAGYYSGGAPTTYKDKIISAYRSINYHSRCPEAGGYSFYQSDLMYYARQYQSLGMSSTDALAKSFSEKVAPQIVSNAIANGENTSWYTSSVVDPMCNSEAKSRYGSSATGKYVRYSGNKCSYTQ